MKDMSNGSASAEKLVGEVSQNGKYTTIPMGQLSFKRRKVVAVRDFPPGCGLIVKPLRLELEQEASEHLKFVDEDLCNGIDMGVTMGNESDQANTPKQMEDKSDALIVAPEDRTVTENSSEVIRHEALEAQPLSICLPDDDETFKCESKPFDVEEKDSVCQRSIVRTKQLHGRKVDVVREFPPNMGSKSVKKVPVSMEKNLVLKKSESGELRAKADEKQLGKRKIGDEESDSHKADNTETQNMENLVRDIVIYTDGKSPVRDHLLTSLVKSISSEGSKPLELKKSKVVVSKPIHVPGRKKAKKGAANHSPLKLLKKKINTEYSEGSGWKNSEKINPDKKDIPGQELSRQPRILEVGIPPSRSSGSSSRDSARHKVKETLRLFHGACRKILQEVEARPREKGGVFRVDFEAAKVLKSKGKYLNNGSTPIMGSVPGVEVGDEFQYRMELNMLGIHRPSQGGIDSMKDNGELVAISIVASGGYDDELDNSDILIYTGQGGNVMKGKGKGKEKKDPEDQQLERGNLALATSVHKKNPVRVIRGNQKVVSESGDAKGRTYVYDGLYLVEEFWQETGSHGKLVFKFKLRRILGQPELSWKVMKKTKKSNFRDGLCKLDISEGKERLPICAVNDIDDEKPPSFIYTANMIYPDWCRPIPPKGCGCTTRCSESRNCACVAKNGGAIPYNYDGAVVEAKPLIYECGPLCKCPPSCYLRVTQRGIKFKLEVFKTKLRGWGVRSLYSIPSGSFICEYAGELLEDKEAERRTGNDEYLFDIGNKFGNSLAEVMMSKQLPTTLDDDTSGFTIDAERKGNIGRFINHSCSPNLYAQNVLYDHEETRIPHVMFFAMDNIPPLQELSYDYNYTMDQVRDANGNIKKKNCYCDSSECRGRLY